MATRSPRSIPAPASASAIAETCARRASYVTRVPDPGTITAMLPRGATARTSSRVPEDLVSSMSYSEYPVVDLRHKLEPAPAESDVYWLPRRTPCRISDACCCWQSRLWLHFERRP